MPPITTTNKIKTGPIALRDINLAFQPDLSPDGPILLLRRHLTKIYRIKASAISNPGKIPATKRSPTDTAVRIEVRMKGTLGGIMGPRVAPDIMLPAES